MARRLITEADVRRETGGTLIVDDDTVITPAALDLAFLRGVAVLYRRGVRRAPSGGGPRGDRHGPGGVP